MGALSFIILNFLFHLYSKLVIMFFIIKFSTFRSDFQCFQFLYFINYLMSPLIIEMEQSKIILYNLKYDFKIDIIILFYL